MKFSELSDLIDTNRRKLLISGAAVATGLVITPKLALSILPPVKKHGLTRSLNLRHVNTGEALSLDYWRDDRYLVSNLVKLSEFLRDWRTGDLKVINPKLFDLMHKLAVDSGTPGNRFDIICGFRSKITNNKLRAHGHSGVARSSKHITGDAIDLRLKGVTLKDLRDAAIAQKAGGVGYYPKSNFIHIDIREKPVHWG